MFCKISLLIVAMLMVESSQVFALQFHPGISSSGSHQDALKRYEVNYAVRVRKDPNYRMDSFLQRPSNILREFWQNQRKRAGGQIPNEIWWSNLN